MNIAKINVDPKPMVDLIIILTFRYRKKIWNDKADL